MEKYLEAEPADVCNWLKEGKQVVDLTNIKANNLKSFVLYQVKKFKSGIDVTLYAGNYGMPNISGRCKTGKDSFFGTEQEAQGTQTCWC